MEATALMIEAAPELMIIAFIVSVEEFEEYPGLDVIPLRACDRRTPA